MKLRKIVLVSVLLMTYIARAGAQSTGIDTVAVSLLDRMSAFMRDLKSCSATIRSEYDVSNAELGLVKHSDEEKLYLSGTNKLLVAAEGDKGSRNFVFNGKTFTYYSATRNHYAQLDISTGFVDMIDSMNKAYGIVFPAADFLYPSFVEDILAEAQSLVLVGMTKVDGKDCYHIAGVTKEKTFQFWIADGPYCLPVKMILVDRDKPMNPQFEALYTDWQINPMIPDGIFDFHAPPNARKIKLTPLNEKTEKSKSTKK